MADKGIKVRIRLFSVNLFASLSIFVLGLFIWTDGSVRNGTDYLVVTSVIAVLVFLYGSYVHQSLLASIRLLKRNIDEVVVSSNLKRRHVVRSNDEVGMTGEAFNQLVGRFDEMIERLSSVSERLSVVSSEMADASHKTRSDIQRQLSETEQAATAMNEMTSTVQEVARNAMQASEAAKEADAEAEQGNQVVKEVIASINGLAKEVQATADVISAVEKETDNIGSVLDVIRGIAEQTNLLALNAAIEAARAGEQGRGFAVVADEVRTLASRTQHSTQEIQDMIERLQTGVKNAVVAMSRGQEKAQDSVEKAEIAGGALAKINTAVATINDMNLQIARASDEQSTVAEEINRNVSAIQDISNLSAQESVKVAETSEELKTLAADVSDIVRKFHH